MPVMNEEVSAKCGGGKIVDATSAIGDVSEDEDIGGIGEGAEDVGESERVHQEAFGELKSDAFAGGREREDAVDAFVDFEVVVGWEDGDGSV